ncbi:hypothetical protein IW492_13545 [Enterococcus sp. BWB1-3]|nr:hypothetical protein [Enterococcus sp. BWB1-3]MBL1230255.1 hypothetical protein [Enterococcus sp. BWB1-3]MCB5955077.1 hypothetical protein [Enterococcus sp. CWB-B31]
MAKKKQNHVPVKLAESILNVYKSYQPESVEDMQETLKDTFCPLFEKILLGELTKYLGYDTHLK